MQKAVVGRRAVAQARLAGAPDDEARRHQLADKPRGIDARQGFAAGAGQLIAEMRDQAVQREWGAAKLSRERDRVFQCTRQNWNVAGLEARD